MSYILGQFLGSSTQNGRGNGGLIPFHFISCINFTLLRCTLVFLCVLNLRGGTSNLTLPYFLAKIHASCVDFGLNYMSLMNPLPPSQNIVT